jgi:thioesterase domain-containing protein
MFDESRRTFALSHSRTAVLEFLGRLDEQIKVRGFRIEPGEIEAALRRHAGVRECVVVAREDRPGDRRLAAYVVGEVDAGELREHLRATLPEQMVPASFTVLPSLPLTPNGKVDRKALPAPAHGRAEGELDEPGDPVEAQLILLWEELLGVKGIGATQSFFELGGNSMLAVRLFRQANRLLGCDLPVATLFAGATVRHMARAILEQKRAGPATPASVVPLQPRGTLPPLFAVHSADRDVLGYVNLARHLGSDQPVFGVRDVGDDLARRVDRIAAEHVEAIRKVQPRGPYHLLSWSYGGLVAFEMGIQLERAGEAVAFIGLMDTPAPVLMDAWPWAGPVDSMVTLAHDVAKRLRRPFVMTAEELEGLEWDEQLRRVTEAMHAQGAAPPGFDAETLGESCRIVQDRIRSRDGYVPGRFSGTLTLFRASEVQEGMDEFLAPYDDEEKRTLAWSRYSDSPVEVHVVPGAHPTLGSEPHVRVLAERMRESLAAARERGDGDRAKGAE